MAELAEAYIHLKPFTVQGSPETFGDRITREAAEAARDVYGFPVTLNVRIEAGSAKIWATVTAIYTAIAIYPDFKEGAAELYNDSREFGNIAISNIKKEIRPPDTAIYRAERRSRDAGRIFRLYQRLEKLTRSKNLLTASVYKAECDRIMDELNRIISNFKPDEAKLLREQFKISETTIEPPIKLGRRRPEEKQIDLMPFADVATSDADRIIYRNSVIVHPRPAVRPDSKVPMETDRSSDTLPPS